MATRIIAASFGLFAGIGGLEHGYFELLQGDKRPGSLMITSMGPPCVPEAAWHACEPAMTIVPSFLVTGLLAMGLGLLTLVWAAAFVQRPHGGLVLALLSLGLLLLGGGIVPPIIGIIGGVVGTRIHAPLPTPASPLWQGIARLWPWTIVLFFALIFGQVVIGYFANGSLPLLVPAGILGLLVATLLAGYGHDIQAQGRIDA